jgi:hypothetical protein
MEAVYDYITWRANIRGYVTLDGLTARSSAEMINDILKRAYLRDMLEDRLADGFGAWRAGDDSPDNTRAPAAIFANSSRSVKDAVARDARFTAFLRAYSPLPSAAKLAIWQAQMGTCAFCSKPKPLRIVQRVSNTKTPIEATQTDLPAYLAVCLDCRRKFANKLTNLVSSHPRKQTSRRSGESRR